MVGSEGLNWGTYSYHARGEEISGICEILERDSCGGCRVRDMYGRIEDWEAGYVEECGGFLDAVRRYFEDGQATSDEILEGLVSRFGDREEEIGDIYVEVVGS